MSKCLHCSSYEAIPDDGHQFSPFCVSTGFDGFCWEHSSFVFEERSCVYFTPAQSFEGGDE